VFQDDAEDRAGLGSELLCGQRMIWSLLRTRIRIPGAFTLLTPDHLRVRGHRCVKAEKLESPDRRVFDAASLSGSQYVNDFNLLAEPTNVVQPMPIQRNQPTSRD